MPMRKWRWPAAAAVLILFAVLYTLPNGMPGAVRKYALLSQITASLTRVGPALAIAGLILLCTVLFGRWYCAVLCPAGAVQDLFLRLGKRLGTLRLGYRRRISPLYLAGAAAAVSALGGAVIVSYLDPLGMFGRLAAPAGAAVRSWLAGGGTAFGLTPPVYFACISLLVLAAAALFRGRLFCERLCPAGALFRLAASSGGGGMSLDSGSCVSCGRCEKVCPAGCIDSAGKKLDADRCVLCLDCVGACGPGALRYGRTEPGRRSFFHAAAAAGGAAALAAGRQFVLPPRPLPAAAVALPGSGGTERMTRTCNTCQACTRSCPVGIVRTGANGVPALDFDRGYCQYNCTSCSRACPAGAAQPLTPEEKHVTRIARTSLDIGRCVVFTQGTACGACAEVCPTHAVSMRETSPGMPTVPDFDAGYCIGCGACYHVCPSEPRAFTVEGLALHERSQGIRPWDGHGERAAEPAAVPGGGETADFPF